MPSAPEEKQKESAGPLVGTIIIFILMIFGAGYFWYERQHVQVDAVPYIPADQSTTTAQ